MLHDLLNYVPQRGTVEWIGLSEAPRSSIVSVTEVQAEVGTGLKGDHHSVRKPGGKRQVTLIQAEHLPVVAQWVETETVVPEQLRRNIVVSGINLISLKNQRFRIGDAIFIGTGDCAPCSRMEETLGTGGYQAMRGHGGLTARVLQSGTVRVGDIVEFLESDFASDATAD